MGLRRLRERATIPTGRSIARGEIAHNDSRSLIGDLHGTAYFVAGGFGHAVMFGASFTDAQHNYDSGLAFANRPIDPFRPIYTGMASAGPIDDRPASKFRQQSLYVQYQMVYAGRLHLDVGLRSDCIETDSEYWQAATTQRLKDEQPSLSAGVLYAFDNGLAPYASYSESFIQEAFGTDAVGNPFSPTRGRQYEAGVKYQPPGTSALFTAAVFDLTKSNMLVADPADPNFSPQTGEATSRSSSERRERGGT